MTPRKYDISNDVTLWTRNDESSSFSYVADTCNLSKDVNLQKKGVSKEAQLYDPYDYGNQQKSTSFWETVFHLYMISSGPALLSIPKNFMAVGYVYGCLLVCLIFLYYWYAMRMITNVEYTLCKLKRQPKMTYAETIYTAFDEGPAQIKWFAPYSSIIIQILYCVTWIGSLNIVLAGENLQISLQNSYHTYFSVSQCILYIFVPLLLLTLIHRLKYLVPASVVGSGIVAVCIITVLYQGLADPSSLRMPPAFGNISEIPTCLAAILFTVNATGLMLPLKNEMKTPKSFNSNFGVLTVSFFPMTLLYLLFNMLSSMKYGSLLKSSVIENLPEDSVLAQIIIFLFAVSLVLQYPLITYVVFDTIWNNMMVQKRKTMKTPLFWEYFTRIMILLVSFVIAYGIPNINVFMSISGTVGTAIDSLIFPALAETLVKRKMGCHGLRMVVNYVKNGCIFILAVILIVVGLYNSIVEIENTYDSRKE